MQSPAFAASTPPIATTGIDTASQISAQPVEPDRWIRVGLRRRRPDRAGTDVGRAEPLARTCFLDARGRGAEHEALLDGSLRAWIVAAQMDAVRAQCERGLDVVVDHERRGQVPEGPSGLDHVSGRCALEPQLDHGRPALDRADGGLEVGHDRVQPHPSTFARESSVAGSRL